MSLDIIILAAGQGTRMRSATPKVLHTIGGKPMLQCVIETAQQLQPETIHVVIGHGGEHIQSVMADAPVHWVYQHEQKGTGHAVLQAIPSIPDQNTVLILSADVPLISAPTLMRLLRSIYSQQLGLLLAKLTQPFGLGRIIRDTHDNVCAIVEEKDANEAQRHIQEIYTGICCARAAHFKRWLPQIGKKNAQSEYYLTEITAMAVHEGMPIVTVHAEDSSEIQGVNTRAQLHELERILQLRIAQELMESGVTLADASRIDVRGKIKCEPDVYIDINTIFEGEVIIGEGSIIGPNCVLKNVRIGKRCHVLANSVIEGSILADDCHVGPFARLRTGTILANGCKIGNFVETKKAVFDANSKASHLSYLGDVTIGKAVNIGAGTITCNYDGANKHQTVIGDGVFIGSDTQLVAPISIGAHATIGAGSTIRKDVPAGELTLTESKQKTVYGWKRPEKEASEDA